KEEIITKWEERARRVLDMIPPQESFVLRNTLSELIDGIVSTLEFGKSDASEVNFERLGSEHGHQRSSLGTYSAKQIFQEYRWLRQELYKCLQERCNTTWAEQLIIQDAFDTSIEAAIGEFSRFNREREESSAESAAAGRTDRDSQLEELAQAKNALEAERAELLRSNKELSTFASTAAHDLKAPLNSISQFIELINEEFESQLDERAGEYSERIVMAAGRMRNLIEKLLFLGRLGASREPFKRVDLNHVLDTVAESLHAAIEGTGARISRDTLPLVTGDETELVQLFQNLIANAVKFTSGRVPEISVTARDQGKDWRISVHDNGIGIKPENMPKLFQPFVRLEPQDRFEGSGLGLSIAKKIVERHGGKISVDSKPGQGTTVFFTLPKDETALH
ncbi:MAG TPA: ATP-binding protein, partial [Bdellovibrionales bacterium]|nr:ATP-binding protein [Bdellovibrionales bacterium]